MQHDRSIHRSATREQQIVAEREADLAERRGIARGIEMSADFIEAMGLKEQADALRGATVVQTAAQPHNQETTE